MATPGSVSEMSKRASTRNHPHHPGRERRDEIDEARRDTHGDLGVGLGDNGVRHEVPEEKRTHAMSNDG